MLWSVLLTIALLMLAFVYWQSRRTFSRAQAAFQREIEQLKADEQRRAIQIKSQQQVLFNSMVEGLLLLDEHGRIQIANRAFTTLFKISEGVDGKTILEVLRLHELTNLVARLPQEQQVLGTELHLPGTDERWIEVNAVALSGNDGASVGVILVFHDLTRIKKLERTRQEFVANVSHELRTPLSLIKGYAETLLDGANENPEVAGRFLHIINRNAERLNFLIEDLLTISELESGRVRLDLVPVGLPALVEKVFSDFRSRATTKGVRLRCEIPDISARADAGRLEQVLYNLVDNAIKYGRSEGSVIVRACEVASGQVEVSVRDDGPGIDPGAIERVFERFYRADKARSREQGGTGLGLAIVKHIVQSHGGKVWVKSVPGNSTTFFFTVPSLSEQYQQA
jgi:two-component system phosphate regulon sensor histidine kinase PhoR